MSDTDDDAAANARPRLMGRLFQREYADVGTLTKRVQERSFAISMSSIALVAVGVLTAAAAYKKNGPNLLQFALVVLIAIIVAFLGNNDSFWDRTLRGFSLAESNGVETQPVPEITPRRALIGLVFRSALMFVAILLDFWAVGYLMRKTGGVLQSPYNTVPATMLILGGLMTRSDRTRVVIFLLGLAFFLAVHLLAVFGRATMPVSRTGSAPLYVFLVVTAVNLLVSYVLASISQSLLLPVGTRKRKQGNGEAPTPGSAEEGTSES